ncbi:MAG TPA: CYTH and CHAD domain-containing protein [Streptosporangiaceae bacterium]|nr:CYTH and CHAD domain-containing protein [Streptosporangiaceae bacterium]
MTETETKYDAPAGLALPRLEALAQVDRTVVPAEDELDAEYYDTADLRLIRSGVTLRRRRGGDDAGWHLKLPAGPQARREIRLPLARSGGRVPAELAGLVRAYTRGEPLRPVVQMTTRRQRVILLSQSGESLAEIAADDVSARTMGDATTASRWQEVEVELTGGDRALLAAADKVLRRDGLRRASHSAKLERALGLDTAPPGAGRLRRSSPAGQVVQAYLRDQAETLKSLDPLVRRDEPDAVHKMRVTTRRLRSTLRAFGKVIPRSQTQRLAAELKWLGGVLGEARDAEVLSGHLRDGLARFPAELVIGPIEARVQGHFAPLRASARTVLLKALDSDRYFALLSELDRLTDSPPPGPAATRPAADVLPGAVRSAYRRTARRMRQAQGAQPGPATDAGLHEARKAAKRARYAGEAVTPALGKKAARFTRQMKKVQGMLGDHQDTVMARPVERELGIAAHLAGENAFSYGLLYEHDAGQAGQLRARAGDTWKKASRARYRHWMR